MVEAHNDIVNKLSVSLVERRKKNEIYTLPASRNSFYFLEYVFVILVHLNTEDVALVSQMIWRIVRGKRISRSISSSTISSSKRCSKRRQGRRRRGRFTPRETDSPCWALIATRGSRGTITFYGTAMFGRRMRGGLQWANSPPRSTSSKDSTAGKSITLPHKWRIWLVNQRRYFLHSWCSSLVSLPVTAASYTWSSVIALTRYIRPHWKFGLKGVIFNSSCSTLVWFVPSFYREDSFLFSWVL